MDKIGGLEKKMEDWDTIQFASAKSETKPYLHRRKFDVDRMTLVLMGDMHIGSKFYDEETHKEHLDWCLTTKSPIILMGDLIETATRYSVGAGVYEQNEIVDKQIEHFYHLFRPLAEEGLILGLHCGNHEQRVYKDSGLDIAKIMARELKVPYFAFSKLHKLRVGKQNYVLYTTHGNSGARMPHTKIAAALRLQAVADADIYAMGHLHQLSHHVRTSYRVNPRNKKVERCQRHFILTGSYLSHWGSYAHMSGLEPVEIGSAKVKLHGETYRVRISL